MGTNGDIYDVIVAGAGPGGSTAAYFLGEGGLRVLVLEKAKLPRYKTCGGGISARVLEQFPFSFDPVIESRVKSVSYILGQRVIEVPLPDRPIRMVMRQDFDAHILSHSGAEVRQGETIRRVEEKPDRVVVETRAGNFYEGRFLVGADGANSIVARALGLRRSRMMAAIEVEAPVPPDVMQRFRDHALFVFGEVHLGYLWIFPKANHLSVGIGAVRPGPGELQGTLKRVMSRYGVSLDGLPLHGHPIPLYHRREPVYAGRILLVGDAAGLVDPLTGEGIRFAVKSGRIAAEVLLAGHPERYPARIQREIGWSHWLGVRLSYLFYHFPRLCYFLGVRNPFATRAFVDLLADQVGYVELIVRLFGTLPVFLATEGIAALVAWLGGPERGRRVRAAVYPTE
jgi:geranylgeranyl reductase family protein